MKILVPLLLCLLTLKTLSQNIELGDCNNVGTPDWSIYEQHLNERGLFKTGATIREYDANIKAVTPEIPQYEYILDKLYLRWTLVDNSINYRIKISDIMDRELIKMDALECIVKVYPDSLLNRHNSKILLINIEQKNFVAYHYWGLNYLLKPMANSRRTEILNQIKKCSDIECQLETLLASNLYIDALSIIEAAIERSPSETEYLQTKYWELANKALIEK